MPRALVVAIAAFWFLLIAVFAELSPFQSPWPLQSYRLDGAEFAALTGGQIDGSSLSVETRDENHGALLVRSVDIADAADWPVLRYRFDLLAPTLEVAFLYRRADSPGDVRTIGFAIYPVSQSVPAAQAFRPFRLLSAEFWSPSWAGRLGATATEWSGKRAWSLMSISALGPDSGSVRARSPVLMLTLGLVLTGLLLWQFAPTLATRGFRIVGTGVVFAWLLLDLRWSLSLADRHAATRQVYADAAWTERQRRIADDDLLAAAQQVRQALQDDGADPDRVRLLVDAESDFTRARLIYHLAPARTGPVNLTGWRQPASGERAYFVVFDSEKPIYDSVRRELDVPGDYTVRARPLIEISPLRVYRLGEASP
jgi:hypothetical protein